jgi:two-component system, response regulator YesN
LTASDGYEVVGILADRHVDLLITDIRMPGLNGFELAQQVKVMRPGMHIIFISGYGDDHYGAAANYGRVMAKPIRRRELIAAIEQEMRGGRFIAGSGSAASP